MVSKRQKRNLWGGIEYNAWVAMKQRCYNPKAVGYKYYGARGITVCERWMHSFRNFLQDMGRKPLPELSLERMDNNGNYEPRNCCWATSSAQSRNKRKPKSHRPYCRRGRRQFGQLQQIAIFQVNDGPVKRLCVCKCGTLRDFSRWALHGGISKNCGCVRRGKLLCRFQSKTV